MFFVAISNLNQPIFVLFHFFSLSLSLSLLCFSRPIFLDRSKYSDCDFRFGDFFPLFFQLNHVWVLFFSSVDKFDLVVIFVPFFYLLLFNGIVLFWFLPILMQLQKINQIAADKEAKLQVPRRKKIQLSHERYRNVVVVVVL